MYTTQYPQNYIPKGTVILAERDAVAAATVRRRKTLERVPNFSIVSDSEEKFMLGQ